MKPPDPKACAKALTAVEQRGLFGVINTYGATYESVIRDALRFCAREPDYYAAMDSYEEGTGFFVDHLHGFGTGVPDELKFACYRLDESEGE